MSGMLVDSNVLLDVLAEDPDWQAWSAEKLHDAVIQGRAAINPLIYAEVSAWYERQEELDQLLDLRAYRRLDLPWEAAFLAGKAFKKYRRRGGVRRSPLPDFYIGAHAEVSGLELLTRDAARFRTYFPDVRLIHP